MSLRLPTQQPTTTWRLHSTILRKRRTKVVCVYTVPYQYVAKLAACQTFSASRHFLKNPNILMQHRTSREHEVNHAHAINLLQTTRLINIPTFLSRYQTYASPIFLQCSPWKRGIYEVFLLLLLLFNKNNIIIIIKNSKNIIIIIINMSINKQ
jgi:hypothetical protein